MMPACQAGCLLNRQIPWYLLAVGEISSAQQRDFQILNIQEGARTKNTTSKQSHCIALQLTQPQWEPEEQKVSSKKN
jgi:hypothetical protein